MHISSLDSLVNLLPLLILLALVIYLYHHIL